MGSYNLPSPLPLNNQWIALVTSKQSIFVQNRWTKDTWTYVEENHYKHEIVSTLDPLINVMDGISVMVGKFCKILVLKYTPQHLISNLSVFLKFSRHM